MFQTCYFLFLYFFFAGQRKSSKKKGQPKAFAETINGSGFRALKNNQHTIQHVCHHPA
jgi:hypothetical protein